MAKTTAPKQKPGLDPARLNELFAKNLEEIRRWYRRTNEPGQVIGHHISIQFVLGYVIEAWTNAIEGKQWSPPRPTP